MINILPIVVGILLGILFEKFRKYHSLYHLVFKSSPFVKNPKASLGKEEDDDEVVNILPAGLIRERIPKHVAVIMDGNRRWAKEKGLATMEGHSAGAQRVLELIPLCCSYGIKVLTLFAFSTENWNRSEVEISFLMKLGEKMILEKLEEVMRQDVRISVIGDRGDMTKLPRSLQRLITKAIDSTKNNSRLHLIVAINYSGRCDIIQACQRIYEKVKDGIIKQENIDETLFTEQLETNCTELPYPDLLIRTSGELRISNFLIWQLAYTELYFEELFWPDFGEKEFVKALLSFQGRNRRFGGSTAG
ncbi:hypothetical protein MKW94_028638 [Papaver nudicaule]|uniref:Alkyl transferase n=1 Tax=Papaver nudicaule TaxID=74823 RepID=A0AA41S657_PAPNU|nr:hypothetical protein [Papaver nudicaule]